MRWRVSEREEGSGEIGWKKKGREGRRGEGTSINMTLCCY